MKKMISILLVLALTLSFATVSVYAAEQQLSLNDEKDGRLEITEAGTYVLTGELLGTVYVDPGEGDVTLVLDGADIDGQDEPGIVAVSGDSLKIQLPENSVNRVKGCADDTYETAIYSKADLTFEGDGSLYVTTEDESGIRTENADLTFESGNYAIKASENGMTADGSDPGKITINGGHFSIQANNSIDPESNVVKNEGEFEEVSPEYDSNVVSGSSYSEDQSLSDAYQGYDENSAPSDSEMPQMNGMPNSDQMPQMDGMPNGDQMPQMNGMPSGDQMPQMSGMPSGSQMPQTSGQTSITGTTDTPSEVVEGTMTNSAASLEADYDNATYISVTDDESQVKITSSGTYVISGSSSNGNITVKKGTTGVVLVLEDLDLTSTEGATVSINKEAEVKIIIKGNVVLTDNENPEDENSEDADVADAFDGAALKAKDGSQVYVTGDGTLTINGNAKNGIKAGDESSIIFDEVTVNISAVNDGINGNYDVTLLGGTFNIACGDDAIHADHILTIGDEDGTGPVIRVTESTEGLEGTVVNVFGGDISIVSSDDAINAANGDGLYEGELDYSFNMTGGKISLNCTGDGIDSNGDVNLIGGSAVIKSGSTGGESGIDYVGDLYISDDYSLNNKSGVSGQEGIGGMPGQEMGGNQGSMPTPPEDGQFPGTMPGNK